MAPVSTNIKIDPELKKQAQELFSELGMNLTTAVNIFLTQAVREQAIPFRVGMDIPNEETKAAMQEIDDMLNNGTGKKYSSVNSLFEDLDA